MEKSEVMKEWDWLVKHEVNAKLEAIDKHLSECSKKLSPSNNGGDARPVLLTSQHQGDNFLCTASVDGDRISKAELNIRVPGKGSKALRTTIKEHAPWKLKQIQDSVNHFQRVQDIYNGLSAQSPQSSLRSSLQQLCTALHQTEASLTIPPNSTAQQIFTSDQKSVLKPELPDDIVVHFHISSSLLVLSVLSVSTRGRGEGKDISGTSWAGAVFDHGNQVYEVTYQVRVAATVPWLQALLTILRQTQELTQDLVDKVKAFDGVSV